ncbi:MAG: hypothetical protein ACTSWQ_01590 [Candidatus Thorarchaeota archaeon]
MLVRKFFRKRKVTKKEELFTRSEFQEMKSSEKLDRPEFSKKKAGVTISSVTCPYCGKTDISPSVDSCPACGGSLS